MTHEDELERSAEVQRRILARANLYTRGFLVTAIVVATGGSALIAWIMSGVGLPFLQTWIVILIIVLLPSLLTLVWRAVRSRE
ncbi:MAG: hypothetical protein L0271_13465 [Gemmatimonadetes bacterium]|nr:hypothetical protein [Gemmatimonadota bacterium]